MGTLSVETLMQDVNEQRSEAKETDNHPQREPAPRPMPGWDYSSDPLKAGGMQIAAVVIGFGVVLLLTIMFGLVWYFLS